VKSVLFLIGVALYIAELPLVACFFDAGNSDSFSRAGEPVVIIAFRRKYQTETLAIFSAISG
jgi:hypothetical protein